MLHTSSDVIEITPLIDDVRPVGAKQGSSWVSAAFLMANAALGAGLLNFPQAYHLAGGVATAVSIQSIFLIFVTVAILMLGYSSDRAGSSTYQEMVGSVCGGLARHACATSIFFYCFGTCITFLIIIGDQWEEFFLFMDKSHYCGDRPIFMQRCVTIIVTSGLFILPLIFPKRIDFLRYPSMLGIIGIVYVTALVAIKYFLPHPPSGAIRVRPDRTSDVFLVVPDICFAYQCHVSAIPIYSCMKKRTLTEFSKAVCLALSLCVFTYTITASLGYLMFGDRIASDILLSLEPDVSTMVAVVLVAAKTCTTYPILLFCGRTAFDYLWVSGWGMSLAQQQMTEKVRRIVISSAWFLLTVTIAVFIPNIGVAIQLLGSLAAVFIFVFPGMCLLKITVDVKLSPISVGSLFLSALFMTIGAFIFGLTLSQSVMEDIGNEGVKPDRSNYTC